MIGEEGIVGAWRGDGANVVNDGARGGFVAANPNFVADLAPSVASAADWARSFVLPLPATITTSGARATAVGRFLNLADGATTIVAGDLKTTASGSTASASGSLTRAGDTMDGFVYINGFNGDDNQAFVGLLPTTDLGTTFLTRDTKAEWAGSYYDSTLKTTKNAITFDIDFSTRAIGVKTGSITAASPPSFDLVFSYAGVISGTVSKGGTVAIARGLIGAEGLVGAFVDTSATAGSVFHGGFVAAAPTCLADDTCAKHAIWLDDFGASPPPTTIATSTAGTTVFGGFLNLADGATTIAPDTFDKDGFATVLTARPASETGFNAPVPTASALPLTRDGDAMDGVVYIGGYNFNNYQAFVGLLSTTNLGDPFPIMSGTTAMWSGKYYSSANPADDSSPVDFLIDFGGARTIDGRDAVTNALIFDLGFTDVGIITGTATDGTNTATASGLIGREGLVGVFVDETPAQVGQTTVLYGGFVADNPNP